MTKLRLKRMGSKYNAFYRIVAADSRAPRDGKFIEEIGIYNPHTKEVRIKEDLRTKWLNDGAQPSDTVKRLFSKYDAAKAAKGQDSNGSVILEIKEKKVKQEEVVVAEEATVTEESTPEVTETPAEETQETSEEA